MTLMTIGYQWFRPDRVYRTGVIEPYDIGVSPDAAARASAVVSTDMVRPPNIPTAGPRAEVTNKLSGLGAVSVPMPARTAVNVRPTSPPAEMPSIPALPFVAKPLPPAAVQGKGIARQAPDISRYIQAQNRAYATGSIWDQIAARQKLYGFQPIRVPYKK